MEQLGLRTLFEELGMGASMSAAAVGSIIARMAQPGSERAARRWLGERSALGEPLGVPELQGQSSSRDQLMLKLGTAKKEAGRAWSLADVRVPGTDKQLAADGFSFRLRRVRRREGRYLLRSNMVAEDPATLWRLYIQLTEIEQAFKELKNDLAIRPIFHQREERIEAHIFVSFKGTQDLTARRFRPRRQPVIPRKLHS